MIDVIDLKEIYDATKIFVNGNWYGKYKDNSIELLNKLKSLKRLGVINIYTSISFDYILNEINIFTDAGRCARPLFIVENSNTLRINKDDINKIKTEQYNWNNLILKSLNTNIFTTATSSIQEGVIEYIDVEESCNTLISIDVKNLKKSKSNYEYCEIHPSLILGVLSSCIPFSNHNQSPRNTYQSAWETGNGEYLLQIIN